MAARWLHRSKKSFISIEQSVGRRTPKPERPSLDVRDSVRSSCFRLSTPQSPMNSLTRRDFVRKTTLVAVASQLGSALLAQDKAAPVAASLRLPSSPGAAGL